MPHGSCARYDVIGVGVSTLDLLMVVDNFPAGEAVLRAEESSLQGGGPVATALVALARLGARVAMVDKVGDDWRGNMILQEFHRERVATEFVTVARERSSSIASILVRKGDGARIITYAPGDAGELVPAELPPGIVESGKIIHLNGRHLDASLALAKKARGLGVRVSFDGGAHRYRPELDQLISLTDICVVARDFALSFSGEAVLERSAAKLLDSGPEVVVITAGSQGCWVFAKEGESFHQPAFEVDAVVDTTGAGDAFHGAFLFGIVNGYGLRNSALLASAVAAMNILKLGGRSALPSLGEALDFLSSRGHTFER